ncbi:hypothetical protein QOZ80_2BG0199000 [Eleusine coracana subsp. coracana]|nr:hypothetical protein QOZ80_2BG0199000 [Eleusine coracana subsp. coracana]
MLARAFALMGKGPARRSHMQLQLRHLHCSGGVLSNAADILEQNWSVQHDNIIMENSADTAVDPIRFATLRSIEEDRFRENKLELLLKKKPARICYVWCDPHPRMSIFQGIIKTIYVNKMVKSGCKVKILMADWFAQMNPQIGGNLNKVQNIGLYNIEMWKAAGMALDGVELVWLSDEISSHADEYWPLVMDIARKNTVTGLTRSRRIGDPTEGLTADKIFNPCLQCASMLFQKVDIWLLSKDLRDAALLATRYCKLVKRKISQSRCYTYRYASYLLHPEREVRKYPGRDILMEDNKEFICRKIEYAFCPPNVVKDNPCLGYIRCVVLLFLGKFEVVRKKENGGDKTFLSMEELAADYVSGALHPSDVKLALAKSLNEILQPARDHFERSSKAKDVMKAIRNVNC